MFVCNLAFTRFLINQILLSLCFTVSKIPVLTPFLLLSVNVCQEFEHSFYLKHL